jgi:hypothetical protein
MNGAPMKRDMAATSANEAKIPLAYPAACAILKHMLQY